jgi:transposase
LNKYPNFIYISLIKHIYETFHIKLHKSTLYNIIHDLNFSHKVAKFQKKYLSKDKLDLNKTELVSKIKNISNSKIISIDEVSFDTNIIHKYAWSLKNLPVVKTIGATYKRLTMICAISNSKIVHYKIINNSAISDTFLDFLKSIPNIKNKYLFLDNAKIHHSKIVKEYVKNNNINLLFNVPYSPEYNPIEFMFSKLKKLVRDCNNNSNFDTLTTNIINCMKNITSQNLFNFFKHSFEKLRIT